MSASAPRKRSWLWLQGLGCGAALSFATGPALLLTVLLAPGLLVYGIERTVGKPRGEPMVLLGLAGAFIPLRTLLESGYSVDSAVLLLSDLSHVAISWTAAAAGWIIAETCQITTRQVGEAAVRLRIAHLQRERVALVEEWGPLEPQRSPSRSG